MKIFLTMITALVLLAACKTDNNKTEGNDISESVEADFADFYKRFLRDTTYQMEHIDFPLAGLPEQMDSLVATTGQFSWQKEDWVFHTEFDAGDSGFEVKLNWLSETLVEEQLLNREFGLGMLRRFKKGRDGWFLIYYAGMNRVK